MITEKKKIDGIQSFALQVSALDKDLGPNSDLEYRIFEGANDYNPSEFFSIDAKTGVIIVVHDIHGLRE